jgi:hypothetical protein
VDPAKIISRDVRKFLRFNRMLKKTGSGRLQVLVSNGKKQFEQSIRVMGVKEPIEEVSIYF